MEGNLEQFPQKIKIDWERLDFQDAKPHERIILEALDIIKEKGVDDEFLESYEVRNVIEEKINSSSEGYNEWMNTLEKSENAEEDEKNFAKGLASTIMLKTNKDERKAA